MYVAPPLSLTVPTDRNVGSFFPLVTQPSHTQYPRQTPPPSECGILFDSLEVLVELQGDDTYNNESSSWCLLMPLGMFCFAQKY